MVAFSSVVVMRLLHICGSFTGCEEDPLMPVKLWDNFKMIVEPYGIPLWLGSPIGHDINNFPVVEG